MKQKIKEVLKMMINEDYEKANELLHEYLVDKSRRYLFDDVDDVEGDDDDFELDFRDEDSDDEKNDVGELREMIAEILNTINKTIGKCSEDYEGSGALEVLEIIEQFMRDEASEGDVQGVLDDSDLSDDTDEDVELVDGDGDEESETVMESDEEGEGEDCCINDMLKLIARFAQCIADGCTDEEEYEEIKGEVQELLDSKDDAELKDDEDDDE